MLRAPFPRSQESGFHRTNLEPKIPYRTGKVQT